MDEAIQRAYDQAGSEYHVASLEVAYVRPDGTLDPTHGELTIRTDKRPTPPPPDDPNRPIGAPVPSRASGEVMMEMIHARCPIFSWRGGVFRETPGSCAMMGTALARPRCTIAQVLARSAAAGAPANALATIKAYGYLVEVAGKTFWVSIDDAPRNIHFKHEVEDTCEPLLEATPAGPAAPAAPPAP